MTNNSKPKPREVFIQGITRDGRTFRPSDWAERLAGAMSCFRPGGGSRSGIGSAILFYVIDKIFGLRPTEEAEREGLDLSELGERAYNY